MNRSMSLGSEGSRWASIFVALFLLCGWTKTGLAWQGEVDPAAIVRDTQYMSKEGDGMTLIWWFPEEFWELSFASDSTVTKAEAEKLLTVFRPYIVVAVVDGEVGPFGAVRYRSEDAIRAQLRIRDSEGTYYEPLREDEIDVSVENFLLILKPMLANMLGPMGENLHFFLFPAKREDGRKIADATKEGVLSIELGEREFKWRLPLESLVPPKICPECGEECSGAWRFCPWCGAKLPK